MPNDALETLSVRIDSMIRPGMMNAAKETPLISVMRDPIAAPKTTK